MPTARRWKTRPFLMASCFPISCPRGFSRFEGGTDRLIGLMHAELLKSGVDVRIRADVERIHVRNGRVEGVTVERAARSEAGRSCRTRI